MVPLMRPVPNLDADALQIAQLLVMLEDCLVSRHDLLVLPDPSAEVFLLLLFEYGVQDAITGSLIHLQNIISYNRLHCALWQVVD